MSIPAQDAKAIFAQWVEEFEAKDSAPLWDIFSPPAYTRKTNIERIEPWATQYDDLHRKHPEHWSCPDCGGTPDTEWYAPTEKLLDLEDRLDALYAKGFREVPNPDYDAERAAEWREKQRTRYNATTITIGQSYNPEAGR